MIGHIRIDIPTATWKKYSISSAWNQYSIGTMVSRLGINILSGAPGWLGIDIFCFVGAGQFGTGIPFGG